MVHLSLVKHVDLLARILEFLLHEGDMPWIFEGIELEKEHTRRPKLYPSEIRILTSQLIWLVPVVMI